MASARLAVPNRVGRRRDRVAVQPQRLDCRHPGCDRTARATEAARAPEPGRYAPRHLACARGLSARGAGPGRLAAASGLDFDPLAPVWPVRYWRDAARLAAETAFAFLA